MNYLTVANIAKKWGMADRTVRNYCATGRIPDVYLQGKTWKIPETALRPKRKNQRSGEKRPLLEVLQKEEVSDIKGGLYHRVQVELTYNSNHIAGNKLTYEQTSCIYETNAMRMEKGTINVDDIIETVNHFKCIDMIIGSANQLLSETYIKNLHSILKNGSSESRKDWFIVGKYKKQPNQFNGYDTTPPHMVSAKIKALLRKYNTPKQKNINQIIEFYIEFEKIHPFPDGNGRIGRLILFKECLRNNVVPFIIDESLETLYYRGLNEWEINKGCFIDICFWAQDKFKKYLEYFEIEY